MCPECAEEKKALAARESNVIKKELSLSQPASSATAVTTTFFAPVDTDEQPATEAKPSRTSIVEPSASADTFATRAEIDEVLEYLKNISKTMTMVRRMVRLFVILSLLSVLSMGYTMWNWRNMFGTLFKPAQLIQQQAQPANGNQQPVINPNPQLRQEVPGGNPQQNPTGDIQEILKALQELREGKL